MLILPYIADILQVLTDELSIIVEMHSLLDFQLISVIVVYLAGSNFLNAFIQYLCGM